MSKNTPHRILYMGTPDFAVPSLRALHEHSEAQNWQVIAVATQPDRRAGRGKKMVMSPVKQYAVEQGIPVLQPEKLRRNPEMRETLTALQPDLFVVAAYGLILPKSILAIPRYGALNVHASLLPTYRGASPIHSAILEGLPETGVGIMLMDVGLDTGPVLAEATAPIPSDATTESLSATLAEVGADLLVRTVPEWLAGNIAPTRQEELQEEKQRTPSYCTMIKKQDGEIDWQQPAAVIERMTRAYAPWPTAFSTWDGKPFKIWQAEVIPQSDAAATPGQVIEVVDGVAVVTGNGLLLLKTVQPAGKRAMDMRSFLNGAGSFVGSVLGTKE
ncbi:MAG: methionyl-tRNA formyltransferase [Chloroflexota bacterium]